MNKSSFFIELEAPIFLITLFVFIYSCEFYPFGERGVLSRDGPCCLAYGNDRNRSCVVYLYSNVWSDF